MQIFCITGQGRRSLTMGREGPGPSSFLAQIIVKVGLGPPLFQLKGAQNDFGSQGPSSFESVTTPLLSTSKPPHLSFCVVYVALMSKLGS